MRVLLCIFVLLLDLYTLDFVPWAFIALKISLRHWYVRRDLLAVMRDCRLKFNALYALQAFIAHQQPLRNLLDNVLLDFFVNQVLLMLP